MWDEPGETETERRTEEQRKRTAFLCEQQLCNNVINKRLNTFSFKTLKRHGSVSFNIIHKEIQIVLSCGVTSSYYRNIHAADYWKCMKTDSVQSSTASTS